MPFNNVKTLLLCTAISFVIAGCKTTQPENSEPLSIVYGFKQGNSKALYLSDENGKRRVKVVNATLSDGYPSVSPSGKQIAFYGKYDKYRTWSIHTVDVDGTNVKRLTHVKHVWDSAPSWSPDGKTIVFAREYKDAKGEKHEEIWLMKPDGTHQRRIKPLKGRSPIIMPDGRLLFQSIIGPSQICIANIDGSNVVQLTHDTSNNMSPKLSPDGTQIAYLSNRDGNQEVYVMDIDGSNQIRVTDNDIQEWGPAWSVDGKKVIFSSQNVHGFYDIFKANKDGSSKQKILNNASQPSTVFHLDENYLKRLLQAEKI